MNNGRRPTEMDQLLRPEPKTYHNYTHSQFHRKERRLLIGSAAAVTLLFVVYSALPQGFLQTPKFHHKKKDKYDVDEQLAELNKLTENYTSQILPHPKIEDRHHTTKKSSSLQKGKNGMHNDNITWQCTSHLIIMRHCEKEVDVTIQGKSHTTDKRDFFGDRHCNAPGKERSEYIATLFLGPDNGNDDEGGGMDDANNSANKDTDTLIPMVQLSNKDSNSNSIKDASRTKKSSLTKPQFPSPNKLYALSAARYNNNNKISKNHKNFREVETMRPLSERFHLDVDERFGVKEEGELATDYFTSLSQSVMENIETFTRANNDRKDNSTSSSVEDLAKEGRQKSSNFALCHDGMTVVNWKHSRIPTLAQALGCGTLEGCPKKYHGDDFDTVWLLTFQYSLLEGVDGLFDDSSMESLSSPLSRRSLRRLGTGKEEAAAITNGRWKVAARLVNEGFVSD